MRKIYLLLFTMGIAAIVNGQVTTNGGSGLAPTYTSLANAITALNAATITSPVIITLGPNETAPNGTGYYITATGTATNTITIEGSGSNTVTAGLNSAGGNMDAIFKIVGGDYITIRNFTMQENAANIVTTAGATNTMTEAAVLLIHASATDGAQNNTVRNCIITLSSAYANSVGILSTSASTTSNASPGANTATDATSTAGTNSNNSVYSLAISNVAFGVMFICPPVTATVFETGNTIGAADLFTGNSITYGNNTVSSAPWNRSSAASGGIVYRNGAGNAINFNTINTIAGLTINSTGVFVSSGSTPVGVTYTTSISGNLINMSNSGTGSITGIDFGHGIVTGTITSSNNNITLNQNATAAVSTVLIGIKANYAAASSTLNTNTVVINQNFSPVGTAINSSPITGMTVPSGTTGTPTMNVLGNTITINRAATVPATFTGTLSGAVTGIQAIAAASTMNVGAVGAGNNNTITIKEAAGGGAGTTAYTSAVNFIDVSAGHATANVVNNTLNTTGSTIRSTGTLQCVNPGGTVTALYNIKSNTATIDRVAASGTIAFTLQTTTPSNVADTVSNNNITFTSLAGTTVANGISQLGGPTGGGTKSINFNTINISGTNSGTTKGIAWGYSLNGGAKITSNNITINCAAPTVVGIEGTSTSAATLAAGSVQNNTISLSSSTVSPTSMIGVNVGATGPHNVINNSFTALNFNGIITGAPVVSGIALSVGTGNNINNNIINNITVGAATSTANPIVDGILISGSVSTNVFKNKIYGIVSNSNGATGVVNGIRISGGGSTGINVYNNLIGDLTAPASTNPDGIRGISSTSTTATSNLNIVYNTVYLSGGGGTNFGSTGIFHTTSTTATTAALNLRNNVIVNNTTPNGTGLAVAYRRSSGIANTLANYSSASNNNLFYAGTPGASNLIYTDGTSSAQTMTAYKGGVFTAGTIAPRDASSVSENPTFLSLSGASTNFLHVDPTIATQVEGSGTPISTPIVVSDDFDNEARNATTPDIGADEFAGIGADLTPPTITYTPLNFTCATGNRTLTASITDASGVPTAGAGLPVLYWRINAGAYTAATGTFVSGSNYDFVFGSGVIAGDVVSYYIVAQDNAASPNVTAFPSTGAGGYSANPPAATTPPTTPSSYNVSSSLSGTYNVGIGQTYTSIGAAINAYNTSCLAGSVTFLLTDASYTGETLPLTINSNPDASSINTLTIKPSLPATVISGSSASAIFILNGADYVTINGSVSTTTNSICPPVTASRDLTIANTNTGTSSAVVWLQTNTGNAATNNAVKNCNITGNATTTTLVGIGSGSTTISASSLGTGNNNNVFENNNIKAVQYGIYSQGASAANKNTGTIINQNMMNANTGTAQNIRIAGVFVGFENNISISGNTIGSVAGSSGDGFGIACGSVAIGTTTFTGNEVINATITNNKVDSIRGASTFSASSIFIATSTNTGTNIIANNTITNAGMNGTLGDFGSGILVGGGAVSTNIYFNSVSMSGTSTGGTQPNFALAIGGSNPIVDIKNNALSAKAVTGSATTLGIGEYAIGYAYSTFTNLSVNNNDYFTAGAEAKFAKTGSLAAASGTDVANLAALQAATTQDAASIAVDPMFNNLSNLQPQLGSPLVGAGVPAGSITADIFCNTRSGSTPTIGAYEIAADAAAPVITYTTLTPNCTTGDRLLNGVTITDQSGVPTAGALQPRVYYRKNAATWFSSQGSLVSGSGTSGTWNFTIVAADMGGLTGGDMIQYYVIAQDIAATPNIGSNPSAGLVATDVNTVTTAPTTPNSVAVGVTLNGTYTVGSGGNYPTLSAAIISYNNACLGGPVVFELTDANYSTGETFPISINLNPDASAVNTLLIRPTGTSVITGGASSIITFNGARFVTVDGRIGSTGTIHSLTITNTTTTAPAVLFINDATSDAVMYADVKSDNTSTTGGVIIFSTTTGANGNDNNTIDNCNVGPNVANPTNGIYSSGTTTTTATNNSGNTISNNNIADFFLSTGVGTGVLVSTGNTDWTITGNSLYQTASRAFTAAASGFIGISVATTAGNNFTVNNNFVGGNAASAGGTAWTQTGAFTHTFIGVRLSVGTTTPSNIQGNTIKNISISTSATSTINAGISAVAGSINVGNTTPNTVGDQSVTGSIAWNGAGAGAQLSGILAGTGVPGVMNISNNTIGGIAVTGSGTTILRGINIQGAATSYTISGNTIGSTTVVNSISNSTNTTTGGLVSSSSSASVAITNNTIANLSTPGILTSNLLTGLATSAGVNTITGNTVRNLSSSSTSLGTGSTSSVIGLSMTSTTAGQTVSQNTVYALSNTDAAAAVAVTGMHYSGPTTGTNVVARNLVYGLSLSTNSPAAEIRGINFNSGLANVQNNMISVGNGVSTGNTVYGLYEVGTTSGSGIYFNSVYVGGSGVGTETGNSYAFRTDQTTNTRTFQNNIFMNERSNATTGGKHYAIRAAGTAPNPAGLTLNYNDYFVTGTGAVFGFFNSLDVADLAAWKVAVGQDANSITGNPQFIAPGAGTPDLHIHATNPSPIESSGLAVGAVTDDYDAQARAGLTPTDIGADAGNFVPSDISAPIITYTALSFTCATGDRALNGVTITDASGVPTSGTLQPRIYYRKNLGTWFSSQGTLTGGTGTNGTWNFTIVAADMGGLVATDAIQYYVIAQDVASTPNISSNPAAGLVATDVNTVTTAPTSPNGYTIGNTLSGTYTVGATGAYPTLTAAIASYNGSCLGGAVVFELLDASYSASETFPISINANPDASVVNTLTIRPAAGIAVTVTGTSGALASSLIRLNGAKYVTIDGLNTGGASLTVENTSTNAGTAAFWLSSNGAGLGASNNTIRNTNIKAGVAQNAATTNTYGIIIAGSTLSTTHTSITAGDDNDNNTITANTFTKVRYGIYSRGGSAANANTGTVISNNIIGPSSFGSDAIGKAGVLAREEDGIQITGNEIRFIGGDFANTSAGTDRAAITFGTDATWSSTSAPTSVYVKNAMISRNQIHDVIDERTFTAAGVLISAADGANATNNTVVNNMMYNIKANGTVGDQSVGIGLSAANGDKVVYNSIYMTGDTDPDAGATTPVVSNYGITITTASVTNPQVINNIVYMDLTSSSAPTLKNACINVPASYVWGTGSSNYNDFHVLTANTQANIGCTGATAGTFYLTLPAWRTAVSQDANSLDVLPVFVSATDLHLAAVGNCSIHRAGTPFAGITTDIDGNTRHASYPDMGADEFIANTTGTVLWNGSVNTNWFDVRNWGCKEIPTATSDVVINGTLPNYPNVTSNVTIKSITLNTGADIIIASGVIFTLLGQ